MKTSDFDYNLPENLIAQTPLEKRDESRLMILDKESGESEDKHFKDIIEYLHKGDVLVLNDTKVIPARLIGEKEETHAVIELLLLQELSNNIWECLAKPVKRLKIDTIISFGQGKIKARVVEILKEFAPSPPVPTISSTSRSCSNLMQCALIPAAEAVISSIVSPFMESAVR